MLSPRRHASPRAVPDYARCMPEGDSLHRAADRLQVLAGQRVEVETPHPRAAAKRLAERLDGRTLESVEAVGKNLLLRFEGGLVLRSHLRMTGRWRVEPRGARRAGRPWLVLRGDEHEAVLWNGPVLELARDGGRLAHLGPDILDRPPDLDAMLERFRAEPQTRAVGDALLDQRLVAGIGNMWKAEALWDARVSPWRPLADVSDDELRATLDAAHRLMRARRRRRAAARATSTAAPAAPAGAAARSIRSYPQGEAARIAYWCPGCQRGGRRAEGVEGQLRCARRISTTRCAVSASARSPRSTRISTRAPTCRSRSRSTGRTGGRRSTSTARSCAASSRRAPTGSSRATTCAQAVADLQREPAARIFARAHEGVTQRRGARALPQRARAAARAHRRRLRRLRLGRQRVRPRVRGARGVALRRRPLVRRGRAARRHLVRHADRARRRHPRARGRGRRARRDVARGDRAAAARLRPRARPALRARARALARAGRDEVPDAPGELADAVTALRLATAAPVAAGPVLFERLDWRPYGIRPVLPIAATAPPGEPTRLDPFRASVAEKLRPQLALADDDAQLGDALDRWELSLFQDDPFRGEQLRHALDAALGDGEGLCAAGMRAAALLGETAEERADLVERFREPTPDLVRRLLVAVLLHGDRAALLRELDGALLGLRAGRERVAQLRAS